MKDYDRMLRVNELLARELGDLCERYVSPFCPGTLVTITKVKTSPDLRLSHVFVSVFGAADQKQRVMGLLLSNRKAMQDEIGHRVKLKYTPKLHFKLDDTLAKADDVLHTLDALDLPPAEDESDT